MTAPAPVVFGPLPSRRFGQSLGINNVPGKRCAYSCVYCQAGPPSVLGFERQAFLEPEALAAEVLAAVADARARGERIDHLTFAPDGEPTLDVNLGRAIDGLRPAGLPIAVLTNGVLAGDPAVAADLARADWVSFKVDAVTPRVWHVVNRPAPHLELHVVHTGMVAFARSFRGRLTTETMLVEGLNTAPGELEAISALVDRIRPATAYVAVPTRPPASVLAHVPSAEAVFALCTLLEKRGVPVERLTGDARLPVGAHGDLERHLLGILSVHPLQKVEVEQLVQNCGARWALVDALVDDGRLARVVHLGREFYVLPRGARS